MDEEFILKHKCKTYKENKYGVFYSNAMIRSDVDVCVQLAESYDEFICLMQKKGHVVDDTGKHIKVVAPGRDRACRLYSLTPDKQTYTKENIKRMIAGNYMTREEVKEKLFSEWNSFRYVKVKIQFAKVDLGLMRIIEEQRLAMEKHLMSKEDAEAYLDYLNRADKEMNIIRKQVRESLDERRELLDQVKELMSLLKYRDRYQQGDKVFKTENDRVEELSNAIAAKGYHLEQLYRYNNIGEALIKNIDDYKKHLYVDVQICRRIIQNDAKANVHNIVYMAKI